MPLEWHVFGFHTWFSFRNFGNSVIKNSTGNNKEKKEKEKKRKGENGMEWKQRMELNEGKANKSPQVK